MNYIYKIIQVVLVCLMVALLWHGQVMVKMAAIMEYMHQYLTLMVQEEEQFF